MKKDTFAFLQLVSTYLPAFKDSEIYRTNLTLFGMELKGKKMSYSTPLSENSYKLQQNTLIFVFFHK